MTFEVVFGLVVLTGVAGAQVGSSSSASAGSKAVAMTNPVRDEAKPFEFGVLVQGGLGVTVNRGDYKFMLAGVHAGKVLTPLKGNGMTRGNFEYAAEVFPFWQSYTPTSLRQNCVDLPDASNGFQQVSCSAPFKIGGTFTGVSITPIILRWNFAGSRRWVPWMQGAGGLIWTNHKYPPFGGPANNIVGVSDYAFGNNRLSDETSVWNFTPQFGIGTHYFVSSRRSVDFAANAVHISSASLGDRNPGVNASVQFSLGYSWWK